MTKKAKAASTSASHDPAQTGNQASQAADESLIEFMVKLTRPSTEELAKYNRREKYQILQSHMETQRTELLTWLEQQKLSAQVAEISAPTAFNVLFIKCTPSVAEALRHAPGVVAVETAGDAPIELISPSKGDSA